MEEQLMPENNFHRIFARYFFSFQRKFHFVKTSNLPQISSMIIFTEDVPFLIAHNYICLLIGAVLRWNCKTYRNWDVFI